VAGENTPAAVDHQNFMLVPGKRGNLLGKQTHGRGIFQQRAGELHDRSSYESRPFLESSVRFRFLYGLACRAFAEIVRGRKRGFEPVPVRMQWRSRYPQKLVFDDVLHLRAASLLGECGSTSGPA